MKKNRAKKFAALGVLAVMTLAAGALAACGDKKIDLSVTVAGAENNAVSATYSGQPIALNVTSEHSVAYVIKYAGADGTVYEESETAPTNAGKYTVSVTYAGDEKFNPYSETFTLTIGKAQNSFTVSIAGYSVGATVPEPVVTGNKGGAVTYSYAGIGETEYTASATAPAAAGTYQITATAAATANYLEGVATNTFEVTLPPRTDVPTTAPALNTGVKVLNDGFTIVTENDTEYRVVDGNGDAASEWQTEAEFKGLKQNTTYFVEARRPATNENAPSAAGENKLEVKTMKSVLLDDFERHASIGGNFNLSEEQKYGGKYSLKTRSLDGKGYILHPQIFVEREDNGNPYGGHYENGSYDSNWVDISGWRYLSFYIYFAKEAESVTFGGSTLELWNGADVFNCWLGQKTFTTKTWHRVVIDLTQTDVLRGDFDGILEQVTRFFINFAPNGEAIDVEKEIGAFYLDNMELLADVELSEERQIVVQGEESGTVNAVYSGAPVAVTAKKPLGGGNLSVTYTGIDGTDYAESATAPTNVGKYKVTLSLTGNAYYTVPKKEVTLVIAKAANDFTVTMANFDFGATPSEPVITGNKAGTPTVTYVGTGTTVYEESATVPTAVGTYKVKVSVAETESYLAGSAEAEFMIVAGARTDVPTEAPALDPAAIVLDDGFTLTAQEDTEYRVVNASGEEVKTWQAGATFTDLQPNTTYTVQARRPAKNGQSPSAIGAQTLQVKTAERFLLDDFDRNPAGSTSYGSFIVSSDKAHGGNKSLKTDVPEGKGYTLQPNSLMSSGNGYWEAGGNAGENYVDLTGYRYLTFYIYFDKDAESVTFGGSYIIEMWKEQSGSVFTCWLGQQTFTTKTWHKVVIDLTKYSVCNGTYAEILAHIGKIYINFAPNGEAIDVQSSIGTFYIDDMALLKDPAAAGQSANAANVQSSNVALEDKFATEKKSVSEDAE